MEYLVSTICEFENIPGGNITAENGINCGVSYLGLLILLEQIKTISLCVGRRRQAARNIGASGGEEFPSSFVGVRCVFSSALAASTAFNQYCFRSVGLP